MGYGVRAKNNKIRLKESTCMFRVWGTATFQFLPWMNQDLEKLQLSLGGYSTEQWPVERRSIYRSPCLCGSDEMSWNDNIWISYEYGAECSQEGGRPRGHWLLYKRGRDGPLIQGSRGRRILCPGTHKSWPGLLKIPKAESAGRMFFSRGTTTNCDRIIWLKSKVCLVLFVPSVAS